MNEAVDVTISVIDGVSDLWLLVLVIAFMKYLPAILDATFNVHFKIRQTLFNAKEAAFERCMGNLEEDIKNENSIVHDENISKKMVLVYIQRMIQGYRQDIKKIDDDIKKLKQGFFKN